MSQNHPHDNIYSILGKLQALEPTPAEVIKDRAQVIRESVESQGSILAGLRDVSTTEQRLAKMFEESKFDKTTKAIEKSGKSKQSAKAIAASIGREKLGQKEMTRRSVAGRKKANENIEECAMCEAGTCTEHEKEAIDENGLQRYTGIKKYGKEGFEALQKAGREGASEQEKGRIKDKYLPKKEVDEERETLATKHGKIYKGGTYGNSYDPGEGDVKPKHVPKAGQKGRPKKDAPMKASVPADPFGRTTGQVPKSKIKGTKIKGKGNVDWDHDIVAEKSVSKAQQKFMGMAHAMQKGEKIKGASPKLKKVAKTMKPGDTHDFAATKHKGLPQHVNESVNFKGLADKHRMSMDECMKTLNRDYNRYQMTGECSDLLNSAMQIHKHHMEEALDRPDYQLPPGHPARTQPVKSLADVHAQDAARSMHPPKLDAPKPAVHDELDEIAKLAGLTDEGAGVMHYKDEKAKEAGKDHFTLGGKTFPVKESDDDLSRIIRGHADAVEHFKQGGELDYDLESDLWDYYFSRGEIRNYDVDASEFIAQRLAEYLGIDEGNAFGLAVQNTPPGEHIKIHGHDTGEIKREDAMPDQAGVSLNELAKLAGLTLPEHDMGPRTGGMEEGKDTCCCDDKGEENCPVHGHDHLDEADAPVDEPEEEPMNTAHKGKYQSMKGSTMSPGEGDPGEKRMYPKAPDGDNAMTQPARGMPIDGKVQESILELEAQLLAEYESIKK